MPQSSIAKGIFQTSVLNRKIPCREHFELTLLIDYPFPTAEPGQFVQILCRDEWISPESGQAILRRPFSIAGLRRRSSAVEIDILGRVIGPGTAWLDARKIGDSVNVLGPLGRAFTIPTNGDIPILVAGGVGLPPIRWLGESLQQTGRQFTFIYGAQSRELLAIGLDREPDSTGKLCECIKEFAEFGIMAAITTDDGTCGLRGRVTDALALQLDRVDAKNARVYACGPEPMLRAVAALCASRDVQCEVAMERVMGCGMSTCQSCIVPVKDTSSVDGWRYALCCREGPVFDSTRVNWTSKTSEAG